MGQDHNGVTDQKTAEGMSSSISEPVRKPDIGSKEEMSQDHLDHLSHGPNGPNSNESLE